MVLGVALLRKGSWSCWIDSMTVLVVLFGSGLRAAGETAGTLRFVRGGGNALLLEITNPRKQNPPEMPGIPHR